MTGLSLIVGAGLVSGALLFVLSAAGAAGMVLLLPGAKDEPIRKMGAVVLIAIALILAIMLGRSAGGTPPRPSA